jgi:hypothetical protein
MFCQIYHYSDYCVKSYVDNSTKSKFIRPSNLFSYNVLINVENLYGLFLHIFYLIKKLLKLRCVCAAWDVVNK